MDGYVEQAKNTIQSIMPNQETAGSLNSAATSVKDTVSSTLDDFSSKSLMNAGTEFLDSNSMIAKFMFIILLLIVFLALLRIGTSLVSWFVTPSTTPYLVHGLRNGSSPKVVLQDPASGNQVTYRSNNQSSGAEFTWSMWLNISTVPDTTSKKYNTVFVKGTNVYVSNGISRVNNGPGVYLTSESTDGTQTQCVLHFEMDVVTPTDSNQRDSLKMDVPNIPIGKWALVVFRLQNKMLDCYVNGTITSRIQFGDYIPKQNYDNVNVCSNGGFPGMISNLRYYDYALSVFEINSVLYYGPNLTADSASSTSSDYLSTTWYKQQV